MKDKYYYPAILQQEDQGYSVWVPDLEGCISQGESITDTIKNISEAVGLFLEYLTDEGKAIPEPTNPENIPLDKNCFISIIEFDWLKYQKKHCSKAVKKTLTIPSYLNDIAEKQHINFSSVLREALETKLNLN